LAKAATALAVNGLRDDEQLPGPLIREDRKFRLQVQSPRPLVIGGGKIIAEARQAAARQDIDATLSFYTNRGDHLDALAREGTQRIALDGTAGDEVEPARRASARESLKARRAKRRTCRPARGGEHHGQA
jgi:hypothetical protein